MIVILDGPEKAGKSTLANKLLELSPWPARIRKWGPINGNDRLYLEALQDDAQVRDGLIVWDRSYASEAVYCKLLPRPGRLGEDPFAGEWDYGRISQAMGVRRIVLGPSVEDLRRLRDSTDHKVCPAAERRMFFRYAQTYGWPYIINAHTEGAVAQFANQILEEAQDLHNDLATYGAYPPYYAGPQRPKVLVLGEPKQAIPPRERSWTPFGSRLTRQLGYALDSAGLRYGWSNITQCPIQLIKDTPIVVACGKDVQQWLQENVLNPSEYSQKVLPTPHPAWLFRYGEGLARKEDEIDKLKKGIADLWHKTKAA
jgi:hypothetical protein